MMRWQMHIYVRGHPKIDRGRSSRRREYTGDAAICRKRRDKQTYLFFSFTYKR
jgi:hypothetical protein